MPLHAILPVVASAICSPAFCPVPAGPVQDHGAHHSPGAEVVWRVPSVPGVGDAAARSAAGKLLADPEFEEWIRRITGQPEFEVPSTLVEALLLGGAADASGAEVLFRALFGGTWPAGVSASLTTKSGSAARSIMVLRSARPSELAGTLMDEFHVRWVIEFSSTEDRAAWLASTSKELRAWGVCSLSEEPGKQGAYRWFAGTTSPAGVAPFIEGPLMLIDEARVVIDAGNLDLVGAGPPSKSHPLFAQQTSGEKPTAGLSIQDAALAPLAEEDPAMAPFAEFLAVCLGPMFEATTFAGETHWAAGDGAATLVASRDRAARVSVATAALSDGALALAHPEAHVAVVTSFERDDIAYSLHALGAGDEIAAALAQVHEEVGISVLPMSRGFLPQVLVTFSTADGAAALGAVNAACDWITGTTSAEISFAKAEYRGATYFTPRFRRAGALETLVQPCIVATDDRLFIASDPALAKREIRRLQTEATRRVHPSLAEMEMPETGVTLAACADWAGLLTDIHGRAEGILKAFGPMGLGPVSPEMLPPVELLTRHLTPSSRWIALTEDGYLEEAHTPFGPSEFVLGGAVMASWLTVQVEERISVAEVALAKADLMTIYNALQQYYLMEMQWPDRLSELDMTPPDPRDPWGSAYRFTVDPEGEVQLWSIGPNLMDEKGDGDDIDLQSIRRQ